VKKNSQLNVKSHTDRKTYRQVWNVKSGLTSVCD